MEILAEKNPFSALQQNKVSERKKVTGVEGEKNGGEGTNEKRGGSDGEREAWGGYGGIGGKIKEDANRGDW